MGGSDVVWVLGEWVRQWSVGVSQWCDLHLMYALLEEHDRGRDCVGSL